MLKVIGVILAGGKAVRLNGVDKSSLRIGNKTSLEWVSDILSRGVDLVAISLAKDSTQESGVQSDMSNKYPIILDWPTKLENTSVAFAILGSLSWAKKEGFDFMITTPVDTPFLPEDYVERMLVDSQGEYACVCKSMDEIHGLHALWNVKSLQKLKQLILQDEIYKISKLHELLSSKVIIFPDTRADCFLNVNTAETLEIAKMRAERRF